MPVEKCPRCGESRVLVKVFGDKGVKVCRPCHRDIRSLALAFWNGVRKKRAAAAEKGGN